MSANQIDKLGDMALAEATRILERDDWPVGGLHPQASRLKSIVSLVDKLRRERTRLSTIQDIAGIRILTHTSLDRQSALGMEVAPLFERSKIDDRRVRPSHGYRALHVIVWVREFPVEIQFRTLPQNLWAQTAERFADIVGRTIRYGEPAVDPTALLGSQDVVGWLKELAHASLSIAAAEEAGTSWEAIMEAERLLRPLIQTIGWLS